MCAATFTNEADYLLYFCKEEIRTELSGKKMHLAKKAIPSKFAWRIKTSRKRPPPSNRSSQIPEKGKRLEDLFTNEEHEDVIQNLKFIEGFSY